MINATWPFAKLTAKPDEIILKVSTFGTYMFPSRRVLKIEKYGLIPFIGWGIHANKDRMKESNQRPSECICGSKQTGLNKGKKKLIVFGSCLEWSR